MQPAIIEQAIYLEDTGHPDESLDVLYRYMDNLLIEGDFNEVDDILSNISVSGLSFDIILAVATITSLAREDLRNYADFVNRAKEEFSKHREDTEEIFKNL